MMEKFKVSPLPIPTTEYNQQYMMQLVKVLELYFNRLDSKTPVQADYFVADYVTANYFKSITGVNGGYYIGQILWLSGTGTPEAVVTAPIGSLYSRLDGGASTTLYVKESGTGNTGWVAK